MQQTHTAPSSVQLTATLLNAAKQAHALYPRARMQTVCQEFEKFIHKTLAEAQALHPCNAERQFGHLVARINDTIRDELANVSGTMH